MGVRSTGSSIARVLLLGSATTGGNECASMHVMTDGSKAIARYRASSSNPSDFVLTGCWTTNQYAVDLR